MSKPRIYRKVPYLTQRPPCVDAASIVDYKGQNKLVVTRISSPMHAPHLSYDCSRIYYYQRLAQNGAKNHFIKGAAKDTPSIEQSGFACSRGHFSNVYERHLAGERRQLWGYCLRPERQRCRCWGRGGALDFYMHQ